MEKARPYKFDPVFRAVARTHQSDYREKVLQIGFDPADPQASYGNILPGWAAKKGYILYEGYRERIRQAAEKRYGKTYRKPLYANLLRSEHIPLNIFIPMSFNPGAAKSVIAGILEKTVTGVDEIRIEYAPSPAENYLNDRTSFDIWIAYRDTDGHKCGIGIEVKYTEQEYKIKKESKEYRDTAGRGNAKYALHTTCSGYYASNSYDTLIKDEFRQIWRNHMLGASMTARGDIRTFTCIHLYPQNNTHFETTLPHYRELLSEKGKASFIGLTFEQLFERLGRHYTGTEEQKWIDYLVRRYIF